MHKTNTFLKKCLWIYFILFTLALVPDLSGYQEEKVSEEEIVFDLRKLRKALIAYEVKPTEENARRLLQAIPEKPPTRRIVGKRSSDDILSDLVDNRLFRDKVIAGDEYLAEAAFRLHSYIGGGHILEELEIMLGQMLVKKPVLFLRLLNKYKQNYRSTSEYPLMVTEILELVPDIESEEDAVRGDQERERLYIKRIKALETVSDPEYMELRDECIRILQEYIVGKSEKPMVKGHVVYSQDMNIGWNAMIYGPCGNDMFCCFRRLNETAGRYMRDEPDGLYFLVALSNVLFLLDNIRKVPDCQAVVKRIKEEAPDDLKQMHQTLKLVFERNSGDKLAHEALELFENLFNRNIK